MVGCGALRCLNVSIKYKKQVDRYEKIVEEKSQAKGRGTRRESEDLSSVFQYPL